MSAPTVESPTEVAIPLWNARSRVAVGAVIERGCGEAMSGLRDAAAARIAGAGARYAGPESSEVAALERARLALREAAVSATLQAEGGDHDHLVPESVRAALDPAASVADLAGVYRWLVHLLVHVLDRPAPAHTADIASALSRTSGAPISLDPDPGLHAVLYGARVAALYDAHRPCTPEFVDGVTHLARKLTGRRILELGAGTGRIGRLLLGVAQRYDGIDISPAMLEQFRSSAAGWPSHATLSCADACALPWPTATFDAVVEHEVLLFTSDPLRAVDEALRVLRPGGEIIRLLVHAIGVDPTPSLHATFREGAAAALGRPFALRGAGTDPHVTAYLRARGIDTVEIELARWDETTPLSAIERSLREGAWPFADGLDATATDEGVRRLYARAAELSVGDYVHTMRRAYVLVSQSPL